MHLNRSIQPRSGFGPALAGIKNPAGAGLVRQAGQGTRFDSRCYRPITSPVLPFFITTGPVNLTKHRYATVFNGSSAR
jgi:hypothetical protein